MKNECHRSETPEDSQSSVDKPLELECDSMRTSQNMQHKETEMKPDSVEVVLRTQVLSISRFVGAEEWGLQTPLHGRALVSVSFYIQACSGPQEEKNEFSGYQSFLWLRIKTGLCPRTKAQTGKCALNSLKCFRYNRSLWTWVMAGMRPPWFTIQEHRVGSYEKWLLRGKIELGGTRTTKIWKVQTQE